MGLENSITVNREPCTFSLWWCIDCYIASYRYWNLWLIHLSQLVLYHRWYTSLGVYYLWSYPKVVPIFAYQHLVLADQFWPQTWHAWSACWVTQRSILGITTMHEWGSRGRGHLCHTHTERGWGSHASKMSLLLLCSLLCSIPALTFVSGQNDCPLLQGRELGNSQNGNMDGLIADTLVAMTSQPPARPLVQVLGYNIVCQTTGMQRDTFRFVSVVVNYTCDGSPWTYCDGTPLLSQFEFECGSGNAWIAGVGGSVSNIFTRISDGDLSTPLRTDCGVCISPLRSGFGLITNNSNHCGGNLSACREFVLPGNLASLNKIS